MGTRASSIRWGEGCIFQGVNRVFLVAAELQRTGRSGQRVPGLVRVCVEGERTARASCQFPVQISQTESSRPGGQAKGAKDCPPSPALDWWPFRFLCNVKNGIFQKAMLA